MEFKFKKDLILVLNVNTHWILYKMIKVLIMFIAGMSALKFASKFGMILLWDLLI